MAKIHPSKPIAQAVGPVYTVNDPVKFSNGGGRKMKPAKPMVDESQDTNRPNKTFIPTMNADKPPKTSKVMGTKPWFDPFDTSKAQIKDANASDGNNASLEPLKSSYEK